jgi:hypothetical protein
MVTEIAFGCMPEKRANYPGNISMQWFLVGAFESFPMTKTMKHKPKTALKIQLREIEIRHCHYPPPPTSKQVCI